MQLLHILVLLFVTITCISAQGIQGQYNTDIQVNANTNTEINFGVAGVGPRLTVTTDQQCSIQVRLIVSANILPNNDFTSLSLGTEVGYEITRTQGTCRIVSATLRTSPLSVTLVSQITTAIAAGGNVGCFRYDTSGQAAAFSRVAVTSNGFAQGLTVSLPTFGQYIFVTYSKNIPLPSVYAEVQLVGGAQSGGASGSSTTKLSYNNNDLLLSITTSNEASLLVRAFTDLQSTGCSCSNPSSNKYRPIGQWYNFDLNGSNSFQAEINKTYSAQALSTIGVTENQLRLGFYNTANSQWEFPSNQRVDTNAKVVVCSTTHFSTWGMYAEEGGSSSSSAALVVVSVALLSAAMILLILA